MQPNDEKTQKLIDIASGGDNLTVYAQNLSFLSNEDIACYENQKILLFRGYSDYITCRKCPKQPCTVNIKRVSYPDGSQKGVCLCHDPDEFGRLEFNLDEMRYWEINLSKLGIKKDLKKEHDLPVAPNKRKLKFEKTAAIATYLKANPTATSKEISKAAGINDSDVRHLWKPIKKAIKEGKSELPAGYKNDGRIEVVDTSAFCKYCQEPLATSFECSICNDIIKGECKTCHFTQEHPDKAIP